MSMYMPAEDLVGLADEMDATTKAEESPEQEKAEQEEQLDEAEAIRRRLPLLVLGSVALSTAATAAAFAVRRRAARRHGVRRLLTMNRRTSMVSPKLFVMLPLSAYVQVVNRRSPKRRFRLLRRLPAGMTPSQKPFAKQLGQLGALRERVPVGKK